ncbi:fatty acid desaturase [Granulosicoccus sp. 3-233]|uniref:fatty acid desaturase n=1 Tax=Granulosicoccus sp. 3-233 TaxID=3417969 RepID=UPI003D347D32
MSDVLADGTAIISRRELKALMKRSNRPGLIHLALWILLLGFTATLVWLSRETLWLLLPAMFMHGIVMVHHFALQHECSHYTAFRSRRLCNVLATVCGFLLFIPPRFFRYEHCDHHTYTNLEGRDPELIPLPENRWQYLWYLSALPYWYSQFSGLLRRATGRILKEEKRFIPGVEQAAVVRESRLMLAGYGLVVLLMWLSGSLAPVFYWWLPMLLAEPVMRFVRMTEHVGRPMVTDRGVNTRSNQVSPLWRFLAWNMNYHAEHHFASSVPFHALGQLHERIKDHVYVEEQGYLHAHRSILDSMAAAPQRQPVS